MRQISQKPTDLQMIYDGNSYTRKDYRSIETGLRYSIAI